MLCSDPVDGPACATTIARLGGIQRLRVLAGLDEQTGEALTDIPEGARVTDVALDALEAIALSENIMLSKADVGAVDDNAADTGSGDDASEEAAPEPAPAPDDGNIDATEGTAKKTRRPESVRSAWRVVRSGLWRQ